MNEIFMNELFMNELLFTDFQIQVLVLVVCFAGACLMWLQEDMDKRSGKK
jgi:hypothetical protein